MARPPRADEITPRSVFLHRRRFLEGTAALGALAVAGPARGAAPKKLRGVKKNGRLSTKEAVTDARITTRYTNYYELEPDKYDAAKKASALKTRPWTVRVEGEVARARTFDIDDILKRFPLEERIYRLRCVEAWSVVVPWVGFPLGAFLKEVNPTSRAKYVAFETLYDPEQMPNQKSKVLDWPYREGLRMDEATHPLTLLAVGMYGDVLPRANGAPIRLVVPWKYGFKSIKAIVKVRLTETQPVTTWNQASPDEYGFFANVNPKVHHPRWSQATERRLGVDERIPTRPFNGYGSEVAHLYKGMDLARFF